MTEVGHPVPVGEDRGRQPDPPHRGEDDHDPTDACSVVQVRDRRAEDEDRGDEDEVVEQLEPRGHPRGRVRRQPCEAVWAGRFVQSTATYPAP